VRVCVCARACEMCERVYVALECVSACVRVQHCVGLMGECLCS